MPWGVPVPPSPVRGLKILIPGLTDTLLCLQLCRVLHRGIDRLDTVLKRMKGGCGDPGLGTGS